MDVNLKSDGAEINFSPQEVMDAVLAYARNRFPREKYKWRFEFPAGTNLSPVGAVVQAKRIE